MVHFFLRRYRGLAFVFLAVWLGGVSLFSKDGEWTRSSLSYTRRIALTFDDGPHPKLTEQLLEILRQENIPATFFVVGRQAVRYPYIVKAMARSGHQVANHTYHHYKMTTLTEPELRDELLLTEHVIQTTTGRSTKCFRPPGGNFNRRVLSLARKEGLGMVLWTVFPMDHEVKDPQLIYERVMAQARDGGVVLLHSGTTATMQALPRMIQDLRQKGYRFLTIEQMLAEPLPQAALAAWWKEGDPSMNTPLTKSRKTFSTHQLAG